MRGTLVVLALCVLIFETLSTEARHHRGGRRDRGRSDEGRRDREEGGRGWSGEGGRGWSGEGGRGWSGEGGRGWNGEGGRGNENGGGSDDRHHSRSRGGSSSDSDSGDDEAPSISTTCNLDIRYDFSIVSPALIMVEEDGEWQLAQPTSRTRYHSFMDLTDKNIKLACPGENNTLTQTGTATAEAICSASSGQAEFIVNGESIPVGDVTCTNRITPYELETGNTCKGEGTEFHIGFIVEGEMYPLLTSCQRIIDGKSYYSQHVLNGTHFPVRGSGGDRKEGRPDFSYYNPILFPGFNPEEGYSKKNELMRLVEAMGDEAYQVFDTRDYKYFARGHFCPNADFIMDTWRDATFTYVNAQPQWQEVNGGNWNSVETYVRYHAAAIYNTLNVITGAVGNLAPAGTDVFLISEDRMPVPNNYVKLVQDPRTNECIGFVGNNFAYSYAQSANCSISCEAYNWPSFTDEESDGVISCCTAEDIFASYSEALPDTVFDCSGGVLVYQGGDDDEE